MAHPDAMSDPPLKHTALAQTALYYAEPHQFEVYKQLSLGRREGSEFAIATHRRDRAGFGQTAPTPVAPAYLVVVQLSQGGRCDLFCDARHEGRDNLRQGGITIMDMRHLWVADLPHRFSSFSFVVPQSMLDELTYDLGQQRITSLECPLSAKRHDETMLGLARALYMALDKPFEMSALVATHLFEAANVHLAHHYGRLNPDALNNISRLASWQERRAKETLGDRLGGDPTLDELARVCDLPSFRFVRAFEKSVGVSPHRWLMTHRIESAQHLLACTGRSLDSIATFCGFANTSHFAKAFVNQVGTSPERFRYTCQN